MRVGQQSYEHSATSVTSVIGKITMTTRRALTGYCVTSNGLPSSPTGALIGGGGKHKGGFRSNFYLPLAFFFLFPGPSGLTKGWRVWWHPPPRAPPPPLPPPPRTRGPIKSWFRQHYFRREPPPAGIADCTRVDFHDFNPSVLVKIFNQVSIAPKVRIQDLTPSDGLVEDSQLPREGSPA